MLQKNNLILLTSFLVFLCLYFFVSKDTREVKNKRTFVELEDRERAQIAFYSNDKTEAEAQTLTVEIVNTPQSTTQGLSSRTEIGADGMFFIFPQKQVRYFWMKDMQFDIDIVWIADNKVVGITSAVPKPANQTQDNRLETYPSPQEINMVLELKANDAERYGISPGDVVQLVE
ncbi:DUF192 domain-containing protein [Candidatus Woesebacteria bacterium]|nr:DUF192 domain-containing protein [Candidatus Woesebacteria bacterium]